jgi:RNA polymerase-binding transcription factor DksA
VNLTALTLLQGRLLHIAIESEAQLQRLRDAPFDAEDAQWSDVERNSRGAIVESLEHRLATALQALDRIDKGGFGLCERCGRNIDRVQLFVRPAWPTCAVCDVSLKAPLAAVV